MSTRHVRYLVTLAVLISATHFLARPHMLAFPFMVAFLGGLMAAADRRTAPSWLLLPVMALWANLHGGFVLGLALIGPIGLEALWTSEAKDRVALAVRWALFGIAALAACCCTPYGWETLLGAAKILSLGKLLSLIWEWMPTNFGTWTFFEYSAARTDRARLPARPQIVGAADHPACWVCSTWRWRMPETRRSSPSSFRWFWPSRLPSNWERC